VTDYYELLGVTPDAPIEEIRSAYRKRAVLLHPDRNLQDPEATENFCTISRAYDVLTDPGQRKAYDESHHTRKQRPESLADALSTDLEAALDIFEKVASLFEVPEPGKRSECTTCGGAGETRVEFGPIVINRSCPDCEAEKPSTVAGDRP
jgi:DnaJ-class molecular chaperone